MDHLGQRLGALVDGLGEHATDQQLELVGNPHVRAQITDARRPHLDVLSEHLHHVLAKERRTTREHKEEDRPQAVDVRSVVDLFTHRLLGGSVERGPDEPLRHARFTLDLHDAEVEHMHEVIARGELLDHDVFRLEVAVGHPREVRLVDAVGDLAQQRASARHRQVIPTQHQGLERLALDKVHHHADMIERELDHVVKTHDMWIAQAPQGFDLSLEASGDLFGGWPLVASGGVDDLDGKLA